MEGAICRHWTFWQDDLHTRRLIISPEGKPMIMNAADRLLVQTVEVMSIGVKPGLSHRLHYRVRCTLEP